jgi:hypothetical protein
LNLLLAVELLTTLEIKDGTMADIELTTKQHNKIKRAVRALNDVHNELQKDNPNYLMQWYLEDGNNFNLMEGDIRMNVINHLKAINYDYLPLCHADGIQDDSKIIQLRWDAGLDPFKAKGMKNGYLLEKTINVPSDFIISGKLHY